MTTRTIKWLAAFFFLAALLGCAGYPVKEQKARDMLNRALLLYQAGESDAADKLLSDIKDNLGDTSAATEAIRMLLGQSPEDYGRIPCAPSECMDAILGAAVTRAEKIGTAEAKKDVINLAVLLGKYAGDGEMPSFSPDFDDFDEYLEESTVEDGPDPALDAVKNAFVAAMALFLENPKAVATVAELAKYGFEVPSGVTLQISDGREKSLAISAWSEKGSIAYSIDSEGLVTETPRPGAAKPGMGEEGGKAFDFRQADKLALSDLKNAYVAAQVYFVDGPSGAVTLDLLKKNGLKVSEGVTVTVEDGREESLSIAAQHEKGKTVFRMDDSGTISEETKK